MRLTVDDDLCIKCGVCASIAENIFEFDWEKGKLKIISQPKSITKEVKAAIESCPVNAIKIVKGKNEKKK